MSRLRVWRWTDATFHVDRIPGTAICETAGWLVGETDEYLIVCSERVITDDPDIEDSRQLTRIPKVLLVH